MKKVSFLWLSILLACCAPLSAQSAKALAQKYSASVVKVSDGDTLTVLRGGEEVKIRLFGVDAPETKQEFGTQARQFLSARVFGKTVTVAPENRDRYGRTVAWILTGERSLNEELVAAGLGWWYRDYARKETQLGELQENARARKLGLWSAANPVEPWEWRKGERDRRVSARNKSKSDSARPQAPRTTKSPSPETSRQREEKQRETEEPIPIWWFIVAAVAGVLLNRLRRRAGRR